MNEKDILQKIKEDSEKIDPPASLHPDAIEQMLYRMQTNPSEKPENTASKHKKQKKIYRYTARLGSMAAVFAIAITVFWQVNKHYSPNETNDIEGTRITEEDTQSGLSDNTAQSSALAESLPDNNTRSQSTSVASDTENDPPVILDDTALPYAESYEEIFDTLHEHFYHNYEDGEYEIAEDYDLRDASIASMEMADTGSTISSGNGSSMNDFSTTNLMELGVDEGDIVKTDGDYIYILRKDFTVAIVKADGENSRIVSTIEIDSQDQASVHEMYLDGNTLNVIVGEYVTSLQNESDLYYTQSSYQTLLCSYDISDRSAPVLTGTVTQDGYYKDSRKNGAYIYLFTSYSPEIQDTYENSTIIPRINGIDAAASAFYLPETLTDSTYLVISSIDITRPQEILDSKILVSGATSFYVSEQNIYIANENGFYWQSSDIHTEITKFHYENGQIVGVAAGSVKGYLNNSFSMNEYDGKLRIVSTYYGNNSSTVSDDSSIDNWTEHNALYILDESLKKISAIEDLAAGETIRSARFFGDTGYFVTFRQTDPLFSVDLSDPANPQILGELKISGFSSYLHFYGEHQLLGIGYEADEETGAISGLKLSMFDISDPENVTEVNRLVLPGITWCPAIESYKSILVEPEKNLIGFYCDNRYLLFSYDSDTGFSQELVYDFYSDQLIDQADYDTMRGLYINHTFYLAGNTFLISFDMEDDFSKTGILNI